MLKSQKCGRWEAEGEREETLQKLQELETRNAELEQRLHLAEQTLAETLAEREKIQNEVTKVAEIMDVKIFELSEIRQGLAKLVERQLSSSTLRGDTSRGGEPELGQSQNIEVCWGRTCQHTSSCLDSVETSHSHLLPPEHPGRGQRAPELLNPPQGASTNHSQTSLDPAMAVAWSRESGCARAALPAPCCRTVSPTVVRFQGEGAEQPVQVFSSLVLGNHLPFANKLPGVFPPGQGAAVLAHQEQELLLFLFPSPNYIMSFQQDPVTLPEVAVSPLQRRVLALTVCPFHCSVASSREEGAAGFKALISSPQWDVMTC
uniref:Uncharacterized protein n=2 Tax=Strigops habroptila TaxID=2489341 RepID=A0A672UY79_STRHB